MQTLGRRAAVGATTVALVLAAAGTSLAAIRSAGEQHGVVPSGMALPAPAATERGRLDPPPTGYAPPDGSFAGPPEGGPGPSAPGGAEAPPGTSGAGPAPGQPGATAGPPPASSPEGSASDGGPVIDLPTDGPVRPPVPQPAPSPVPQPAPPPVSPPTLPSSTVPTITCPSDVGEGALPVRGGRLEAVNFILPWPGRGPLVVVPQASAARAPGAPVRVRGATPGNPVAADGSSLSVDAPAPLAYTLSTGSETAVGSVNFVPTGARTPLSREACRDRRFVLYDVRRASLDGSALRIVGYVAPTAKVTISDDGGTAYAQAATSGVHQVILLTASDKGVAGAVITATVTVG